MRLTTLMTKLILASALACMFTGGLSAQEMRKALAKPTPHYPEIARRMNLVGSVKIEIVIGTDGKVKETNVLGGHPVLVDSALMTLKEWKYEPAKSETTMTVVFDFKP